MIQPLFDQVQIEIQSAEVVTSSGITIPGNKDVKLEQATVIAVGPDVQTLKVGDNILLKSFSSDTITIDNQEISFVKEENVLATI